MKRQHAETVSNGGSPLVVDFACFVTCLWKDVLGVASPSDLILGLCIPGCVIHCVSLAVSRNQTMEVYMECGGTPLTRLLLALENVGMCCIEIFTFGLSPTTNGAPEALARIDYRVKQSDFTGFSRGVPSVQKSVDFDIRDKYANWTRFTVDQMGLMLTGDASRPSEVVDWCVVVCNGDTSHLESRLRGLRLKTSVSRQYYVKGFECMLTPTSARVYMEVEPVVKTVLHRCLMEALCISIEVLTFPPNQQAIALGWVFELGGILIEHGNLSDIPLAGRVWTPTSVIRFTQQDLAVWECVVQEPPYNHWALHERDIELTKLQGDMAAMCVERSLLQEESSRYSKQCGRFFGAFDELKLERDRLRRELDIRSASDGDGLISWTEWEMMRNALVERDACISQLRAKLGETCGDAL